MFSHDRIDDGSELLASRLPVDFPGDAADFGAGWGYLSVDAGRNASRPQPRSTSSRRTTHALEAAKANIVENCPNVTGALLLARSGGRAARATSTTSSS